MKALRLFTLEGMKDKLTHQTFPPRLLELQINGVSLESEVVQPTQPPVQVPLEVTAELGVTAQACKSANSRIGKFRMVLNL